MNTIANFHWYLILNSAIALGYIITRIILCLPFCKLKLLQAQRLKFSRYSFMIVLISFIIMPHITTLFPNGQNSNFQLEPIIKNTTVTLLQHTAIVDSHLEQVVSEQFLIPINTILIIIFLIGFSISLAKYIINLCFLKRIQHSSFCRHNINSVSILFNGATSVPFCWSLFKKHFIVLPVEFLERKSDLMLAIRHELQHIRQVDPIWLNALSIIKIFCFWNPFLKLWIKLFDELQEFACDETLVLRQATSRATYAQCLVDTASNTLKINKMPQGVLGINGLSQSLLYKRVDRLFDYKQLKNKIPLFFTYIIAFLITMSTAYAFSGTTPLEPLSAQKLFSILKQLNIDNVFHISATPEVLNQINNIRSSDQARSYAHASLERMKGYDKIILDSLNKEGMPNDLIALPFVESGFKPLDESENSMLAAGIWQIIPSTAKHLGLVIDSKQDDRLNTSLSTIAAIKYLKMMHVRYNDWKLAVIAYEYGEETIDELIKTVGSRDAWVLANSIAAPKSMKKFITLFDSTIIIMHNASLIEKA